MKQIFDLGHVTLPEGSYSTIESSRFNQYVNKIVSLKEVTTLNEAFANISIEGYMLESSPPYQPRKNVAEFFLPQFSYTQQRLFYGTDAHLQIAMLFYELYSRFYRIKDFSEKNRFIEGEPVGINESINEFFYSLFVDHMFDQIDDATYTLCVLKLFGMEGVPFLNLKKIAYNVISIFQRGIMVIVIF